MAKFNIIEMRIKNGKLLDLDTKSKEEKQVLKSGYVVYIYRGSKSKKIYIGQSGGFLERHKEHYSGREEKFNRGDFNQVMVILSRQFNGSSLDDVEKQLITYFSAEYSNFRTRYVEYDRDEVVNGTGGNSVHEYVGREKVASEVILPLWENVLFPKGWVKTKTLDELRAKELVKYSPIKTLSSEQKVLIDEILAHPELNYLINGDAGTGKTVLLTHLVAAILKEREDAKIGVVVQPNWEKTGEKIFKVFGMSSDRLTVKTSTKLIGDGGEYDIIIVDESHKMSRRGNKQHNAFNEVYRIDRFKEYQSHLEILQKMGKQIILMYDVLQAIRPANVSREKFQELTEGYEKRFLTTQFRIRTAKEKGYTSEDYINGIKYLLYKDTGLLDSKLTNFNPNFNRELFRDTSPDAYFGYVTEQPLHKLIDWLEEDNNFHPEHVNRVLAGLVEDWRQSHGKNPKKTHFKEGEDLKRRWNSTQENWINSKDDDAEEQIGSVFAVQGIDLNKVGVLIGKDLQVDAEGKLFANPKNFYNVNGIFTVKEMKDPKNQFEFTLFVLNIYYVLLTRGIDGVRVGFWDNDAFREYMEQTLEII